MQKRVWDKDEKKKWKEVKGQNNKSKPKISWKSMTTQFPDFEENQRYNLAKHSNFFMLFILFPKFLFYFSVSQKL